MVGMKDSGSSGHGSKSIKQLRVVDFMNDSGSRELKPLDVMNHSGQLMILMILYHEVKPLDAMKSLGLWIT